MPATEDKGAAPKDVIESTALTSPGLTSTVKGESLIESPKSVIDRMYVPANRGTY
jgi:hypothetical protein